MIPPPVWSRQKRDGPLSPTSEKQVDRVNGRPMAYKQVVG